MHFHVPKPLHGWREFVGEVGIIVLGVLIALGAEQLIESWNWRGKVSRAEAAMRLELAEDDGPQAYARVAIGGCLDEQIARIHGGVGRVPPDRLRHWIAAYSPPFRTWDSEAWKAVVASDVGSHMGPDRLVQWSAPYRIMPSSTDLNQREWQLAIDLREALPPTGEMTPENAALVRRTSEQLRMLNRRLVKASELMLERSEKNGAAVPMPIQRVLLSEARAMYGTCTHVPDLKTVPEAEQLYTTLRAGSSGQLTRDQ
jgi:hypothetical protein